MRVCQSSSHLFKLSFLLVCVVKEACFSKSVTYFMSKPAENCTTACVTRGMSCVRRNAFPYNSLYIFRSINVTCTTVRATNWHYHPDQPNLILLGDWKGRCTGFWDPSSFTNCGVGGNPAVRRLCPCEHLPTSTPVPPTVKINTTVATTTTTIGATTATTIVTTSTTTTATTAITTEKHATQLKATTPPATTTTLTKNNGSSTDEEKSRRTDVGQTLSTWKIIVILLVHLVVCGIAIAILVAYKRKRKRQRPGPARILSQRHLSSQSIGEVSQNPVYMDSMIDITQTRIVTRSGSKDYLCDVIDDTYYSSPFSSKDANTCYEEVNKTTSGGIDEYQNPHYETLDKAAYLGKERSESLNVLYEEFGDNERSSSTDNILYDRSSKDNQLYERSSKDNQLYESADNLEDKEAESDNPIYGKDIEICAVNNENINMEHSGMYASVDENPIYGKDIETCAVNNENINMEHSGMYASVDENPIYVDIRNE